MRLLATKYMAREEVMIFLRLNSFQKVNTIKQLIRVLDQFPIPLSIVEIIISNTDMSFIK